MSLIKKLRRITKEYLNRDDFEVNNTGIRHIYKISYHKEKSRFYYYSSRLNFKENINKFKLILNEYIAELNFHKIENCKYCKKILSMSEYEKCMKHCFYRSFCRIKKG